MNASKLSAAAMAPANSAPAVEGYALLSPTGVDAADAVIVEVTTEFQSLIEQLLPDGMQEGPPAADSGDAGNVTDAATQTVNPDFATAQLLLQLPPLVPAIQLSSSAAAQESPGVDTGATTADNASLMLPQTAAVVATLPTESDDANDQTVPGKGPARIPAAAERTGSDSAGAWLTQSALPAPPLKLQETTERPDSPHGHQGGKGAPVPTLQSLPTAAAAIAVAVASARELPSLPRMENSVGTAAWRQELANTVNLMIDRGEQSATLRLTPEHLGPLEVRIAIREGEASLWFGAAHADTRQALEQSLPRLREQFASAGLSLGQSSVSQGPPQEPRNLRAALVSGISASGRDSGEISAPAARVTSRITGLIDTYV